MISTPVTSADVARAVAVKRVQSANDTISDGSIISSEISQLGGRKPTGFGLPCAKCRTYYPADVKSCPVCKSAERVSPLAAAVPASVTQNEQMPDPVALEEERERFLREFKAQVFVSQLPITPVSSAYCSKDENHQSSSAPATVCQDCYDQLQERVDVLEAALHMDLKEAAQIIYDAVWADPSDPGKTYQNAAHALLSELRKRSGVTPTFGPLTPMLD
jgi:hypothetical protein